MLPKHRNAFGALRSSVEYTAYDAAAGVHRLNKKCADGLRPVLPRTQNDHMLVRILKHRRRAPPAVNHHGVDGRPGLDSAVICRAALEEHSAFDLIDAAPQEVAQLLRQLWGGPETLIVASSDLSHITATRLHRVWIYRLPKPSNKANGPVWARVEPVAG